MELYSGWQYMLIDLANHWGLDKKLFGERIQWAEDNLHQLEKIANDRVNAEINEPNDKKWKEEPLFRKAILAIRKVQKGLPTGHMVGLDACCSGIQVMSCLTGCIAGATNTGLVDPTRRMDAYGITRDTMEAIMGGTVHVDRQGAKDAVMTGFYGSKKVPKEIFGEDTPELEAFYKAMTQVAPGAWELLEDLRNSWQPNALSHEWKLPDGFDARVKVMQKIETRIEVDELNHSTFSYEYYINQGTEKGLSNIANIVHSVDGYVLRTMHRRMNYDKHQVEVALSHIYDELDQRNGNKPRELTSTPMVAYYVEQFNRSTMADVVILPWLNKETVKELSTKHLSKLRDIILTMLVHKPFPLGTVHDEFKCSPNNMNHLRQHYINILAEIAESNLLDDLLSQVYKKKGTFKKLSTNLGQLIRGSNYGLS